MSPGLRQRSIDERGTASAELVILVVPIMTMVLFAAFVGRYASAHQHVISASRDAARAAAVRQMPAAAARDASDAVTTSLDDAGLACRPAPDIALDLSQLEPGGQVTATITCTVDLSDLAGFGLPGTRALSATSTTPVDTYRGGEP